MRIKIKDNAAGLYSKRTADFQYSPEWYKFLKEIQGKVIEVKTNYLFEYFFNFEYQREGEEVKLYAVTGDMVKKVLEDERFGRIKCIYCGRLLPEDFSENCPKCNKGKENLYVFIYTNRFNMVKMKLVPLDSFKALPVLDITNEIRRVNHEC